MKIRLSPSPLGIKQTPRALVKLALLQLALVGLGGAFVTGSPIFAPRTAYADETSLPPIEAKTFDVTVKRRSRSGRVYLFETPLEEPLHVGKLILLRQNDDPVMAFRVLRDYPDKNQFAAKWLRKYRGIDQLESSQQFLAIEKIADRAAPPLTEEDRADLKEIESENIPSPGAATAEQSSPTGAQAPSYDPDLDASTTPPPKNSATSTNPELTPEDEQEIDDLKSITAEELKPFDRNMDWFTLGFGFFRNNGASSGSNSGYLGGLDVKFARTISRYLYFKRNDIQDSLALEGGLGYYKLLSYAVSNDAYTVIPMTVTLRYNALFSENFGAFGYVGFNKNVVVSKKSPTDADQGAVSSTASQLNSFMPAFGVGLLFRVGPSWYIRMEAGYDLIGLGLLLRF